ncbi:hypothetical protein F4824DRAFT_465280 [Ustulina deusta]|nr:hypothetical protein F4824DRAFT_465280 [Ustulina deusta]
MEDEDFALTVTILVTLYTFPVVYLTAEMVAEYFESARDRDPPSWWVEDGCARLVVGLALSISLFLFYLVFVVPLAIYAFARACRGAARTGPDDEMLARGRARQRRGKAPRKATEVRARRRVSPSELSESSRRPGKNPVGTDRPATAPPTGRSEVRRRNAMDLGCIEVHRIRGDMNTLAPAPQSPEVAEGLMPPLLSRRLRPRSWMSEMAPRTAKEISQMGS